MLLTSNSIARPDHVWNQTWEYMSDHIEHEQRLLFKNPDLEIHERHRKNLCLQYIDKLLRRNGSSLSSISRMPLPDLEFLENHTNSLIHDEICYNPDLLKAEHERLFPSLTAEQKIIYARVISVVENNKGGVLFLYGYGGGHTIHSRFGIPINVNEYSFCSITAGTDLVALLIKTSLIIWDEAPMMHIHCGPNDGEATIDIPDDILISDNIDPIASLIKFVYPFICESEGVDNTYTESLYSLEVLNGLKLSGIPNHRLALKVGAPVTLL
ncbi:ATP-dependent DNA helicase PIF1-like protein [Tanacetum coccineum]